MLRRCGRIQNDFPRRFQFQDIHLLVPLARMRAVVVRELTLLGSLVCPQDRKTSRALHMVGSTFGRSGRSGHQGTVQSS